MAEPLAVLLQVHEQAVEQERLALVTALDRWDAAVAAASLARRAIVAETEAAQRDGADTMAEAFAAWLPGAMASLAAAERREAEAEAATVRQRASLAAARARTRATERVLQAQAAERLSGAARRHQADLDEAGLRAHRTAKDDHGAAGSG